MAISVHIRWMIRHDMPSVLAIEEGSFENPWAENDFLRCLRQRNCIGMVAEKGDDVLGYMLHERHKDKFHLRGLAVHPDWRRSYIGAQMVAKLKRKTAFANLRRITLEVRESNLAAQLFFRSQGFTASRILRGHYEDTGEDAYEMRHEIEHFAQVP